MCVCVYLPYGLEDSVFISIWHSWKGRVWYRCKGVRDRQAEWLWLWLTEWTGKAMD